MSENILQILNIIFALGSIPPTLLLIGGFIRQMKSNPKQLKTTLTALIFLFTMFMVVAIGNILIAFFFLFDKTDIAVHYASLRTLYINATLFTVSWSLYLIQRRSV